MQAPLVDIYIVDSIDAFKDLQWNAHAGDYQYISLDVETDSVNEKTANLFGIGLCFDDTTAYYIPIRNNKGDLLWSADELTKVYYQIAKWSKKYRLIGWNLVYDCLVFERNSGHRISDNIYADGILLKHCVDESRPFGLKEVAVRYLGSWADKAQEKMIEDIKANGGSTTKENMEMYKASTDVLAEYCAWDVLLTRRLFDLFFTKLHEEGMQDLFFEEVMPLYREVTVDMKRHGFCVDVEHFKTLKHDIEADIANLEDEIMAIVEQDTATFVRNLLNDDYPCKRTGSFPKYAAKYFGAGLPVNAHGATTLAKKFVEAEAQKQPGLFYDWLLGRVELSDDDTRSIQRLWFSEDVTKRRHVFNLKSNDHLGWLLFTHLGEVPASKTETGKPQCDESYLESLVEKYDWVKKLVDYKKLNKLASTYIEGILEREIDGVIYSSMLQFGTTSGRYSSTGPNLQNVPRLKEEDSGLSELVLKYANAIKKGFIAPKGYKILNADYSALEPRCFAHASGDETLRDVFRKGLDLYSQIAIDVFGLHDCSADPKDPNYLKKKYPEKRQLAKVFALAVVYGAEAGRISQAMGIDYMEAEQIIDAYLEAYPGLKNYMLRCEHSVKKYGFVKTDFGRVRHLSEAKELYSKYGERLLDRKWSKSNGLADTRYRLKNSLNLGKNHPIQGIAAHIVNRAMIATTRAFKEADIDGWIVMQVHDEITCIVHEDQTESALKILKHCMENTTTISIPLQAEPIIGSNWAEVK